MPKTQRKNQPDPILKRELFAILKTRYDEYGARMHGGFLPSEDPACITPQNKEGMLLREMGRLSVMERHIGILETMVLYSPDETEAAKYRKEAVETRTAYTEALGHFVRALL